MNIYKLQLRSYFLLPLLFLAISDLAGQDMTSGFRQLESGEFEAAKEFFEQVLNESPNNKTALICYGRAVGLSGNPDKSLNIFNQLNEQYQQDTEVLLNLAEAQLWGDQPTEAIPVYQSLLKSDSSLFAAWLGLANSFSMAKKYPDAYETIQRAMALDTKNQQALISRKYIVLGYASELGIKERNFEKALSLINENLAVNPADQESLMLQGSLLMLSKQYDQALNSFQQLESQANSLLQQSLVLHLAGKDQNAYQLADSARNLTIDDQEKLLAVKIHFLNTLLWNGELKQAKEYYAHILKEAGELPSVLFAGAQLAMYDADFETGVANYQSGLINDSTSFAGNLGLADANHALKLDSKAYQSAFKTLEIFQNQQDVLSFLEKLNASHNPFLNGAYVLSGSSDGSRNRMYNLGGGLSISPELAAGVHYENKVYNAPDNDLQSEKQVITAMTKYQLNKVFGFEAKAQVLKNTIEGSVSNNFLFGVNTAVRVNKFLGVKAGYKSEILDFNSALFARQLRVDHLFLQSNFYITETGTGNYTELMKSYLSDGNERLLFFTSCYQNIGKKKYFKTGVNYLNLSFGESKPADYFSPLRHQQVEVFLGFNYKTKAKAQTKIQLEAAYGYQWNTALEELTLRSKLSVVQKYKGAQVELFGQYSTAANATFNGFSFHEYGVKVKMKLTDKPVFFKKLKDGFNF